MYLHALATALPETRLSQADCWELISRSPLRDQLSRRSRLLLQSILRGDSGIDGRNFAFSPIERIFTADADELNEAFRLHAPRLAARALSSALAEAGLQARELDALLICTCTGYLCPGLTSYVSEQLGLRPDAHLQDLVGLGCGAAIPMLRSAEGLLRARPAAAVACIAVELCSAAFYLDDDPGVLVSACLFGDGAAATIWRADAPPAPRPALRATAFDTHHAPAQRDKIRFEQRHGKLRNLLAPEVPALAAEAVARLHARDLAAHPRPPARILAHPGGRDVLDALELALPRHSLEPSRRILREHGNLSSPSVLFALAAALREGPPAPGEAWWLTAFGAGFAAHACRLVREG